MMPFYASTGLNGKTDCYLLLDDGSVYPGKRFGANVPVEGEIGEFAWICEHVLLRGVRFRLHSHRDGVYFRVNWPVITERGLSRGGPRAAATLASLIKTLSISYQHVANGNDIARTHGPHTNGKCGESSRILNTISVYTRCKMWREISRKLRSLENIIVDFRLNC